MSNNIYDILGKLNGLQPTETPVETAKEPVYETVDAKGDIMEAVRSLEEKYMGFKKTVAAVKKGGSAEDPEAVAAAIGRKKYGKEKFQKAAAAGKKLGEDAKPDFLDLDKDGDTEEPMKQAAKDAKEHEPAKPDSDAVAKRKRLQALKDKQEDERAEKGDYDDKSSVRTIKGRAYGGAAQRDAEEKDDLDEVAPPGAKAERMVKHIKKGYAKDGKLTPKEKSIAYATAWKAHNKGQVEEGHEFGSKDFENAANLKKAPKAKLKESAMMEASSYTYEKVADILAKEQPHLDPNGDDFQKACYDQLIKMHLSPKSARWNVYYDEDFLSDCATAYAHNLKHGQDHEPMIVDAEQELDEIARLAGLPTVEAKTCSSCGCEDCKCSTLEEAATRKDFRMVADLIKNIPDKEKRKELAHHHANIFKQQNPRFSHEKFCAACNVDEGDMGKAVGTVAGMALAPELGPVAGTVGGMVGDKIGDALTDEAEEMDEGNEFTKARLDAIAQGKDEFTVGGKVHKVTGDTSQEKQQVEEDISVNVTASGEEDFVKIVKRLSGLSDALQTPISSLAPDHEGEEVAEERDIEWNNTPEEQTAPLSAAIPSGNDLHKAKRQDPATANKAANPLAEEDKVEESLWKSYESMISDIKA